jgi:putative ABC transport system permease protein
MAAAAKRPRGDRLYATLLHLYPASFRLEYGGEMRADFAARRARAAGLGAVLGLWLDSVLDVIHNAVQAHVDVLRQDLRFTFRTLRRAPGFTTTAVLLAALGVAATTATFSIADHVLLRPLPFRDPDRLVRMWESDADLAWRNDVSPAHWRDWQRLSRSFAGMENFHYRSVNLVGGGEPQRLDGAVMSAGLLRLLGRAPAIGRDFAAEDDRKGAAGTVLIGDALWRSRFAGDPAVLGRKVLLDDEPYEVIGVMPADFAFPGAGIDLWTTNRFGPESFEERGDTYTQIVARLRPGVSPEQAQADMRGVTARLARTYAEDEEVTALMLDLRGEVPRQSRLLLAALCGAALCMLLTACTNLASLLISRAFARRRELAVRTALGGGRERLLRQLVTESLVLAAAGGLLGILGAVVALPMLSRLVPATLPFPAAATLNLRVLAATALITAITGIAFGVVPVARACMRVDATDLREGARGGVGDRRERLRAALVVAEVTATVVLLVCSGLLARALLRLNGVDAGFRSEGVLTLRTDLPLPRYGATARRVDFYRRVLGEVRALPGVTEAAYVTDLPMVRKGGIWPIGLDERPDREQEHSASLRYVTPGYFATMGIPLRRGRDVAESDGAEAEPAAVVSESFVKLVWPDGDPLNRTFRFANQKRRVVGVVGDVRVRGLEQESEPQVYLSYQQVPDDNIIGYVPKQLVIRSPLPAASLVPAVRGIVARVDPRQPISAVRPLADVVSAETAPRAIQARVLGLFTLLAFLLAAVGIHGLLAFTVSARAPEIGLRMALGAERREILGLVLGRGATLAAAGVAIGAVLAYAAARGLQGALAGVSPGDPSTFAGAVALSAAMVLLGSLLPALRAMRLDPLKVIRTE